ncbi:MAG: DNA polymerase III subunit gamma/tau [Clostridia bacterium]|nr:DNA polymerase III subunit gamma/tau [Clostridia bacterium]
MYRVLYRKWRPQTFKDVSGQPHITETLMNEVRESRLAHAYLFTGSRGTGKTSCAKILSKAINCLHPVDGNPCNECDICRGIDSGTVLDVVEIDAASNRGIDDIRALREESAFTPAQAKYRVYIIDEVHMLTIEAFNALLKTLEEPPEHIVFILATTEVQKLPSTILSRCQRFDFRRISVDALVDRLKYVAQQEQVLLSDDAAVLIARIADGGMRDALSIFDRCLSISENVNVDVVSDAAGIMSKTHLFDLSDAFINKDTAKALAIVDELHNSSCDTERLCTELTNHFRSLLIIKSVKKPEEILVCTNEELTELKELSDKFSIEEILSIMNILSAAIASIKVTQNRRIETEMAMIKICSPEVSDDISSLYARIAQLEKKIDELSSGSAVSLKIHNESPIIPVAEQKKEMSKEDILNSLVFDDDSAEYDDEPPFDISTPQEEQPIFDEAPVFDEIPLPQDAPVFDEPPFDNGPVFDPEPTADFTVFDPEPVENNTSTTSNNTQFSVKMWTNCIIEAEKLCPPITGHLLGTKAEIIGESITITNYKSVLPMIFPMCQAKVEEAVKNITGRNLSVRLG